MKRLVLLSVLAIGCAHAPLIEVSGSASRTAPDFVHTDSVSSTAMAAVPGAQDPKSTYGAVQIAFASSTAVFTVPGTALPGRNAFSLYNNGPNTIWCGFDASVTNVTGWPVASGTMLAVDLVFLSPGPKTVYCRSDVALQVSPADTRWLQVR